MSAEPTEEQIQAYEEELSRLSSVEIAIQAAASLISIGGQRLGLVGGGEAERDLEQVRDAIDGARALLPILERRMPAAQVNQLKGALSQLQLGYAQLVHGSGALSAEQQASAPSGGLSGAPTGGLGAAGRSGNAGGDSGGSGSGGSGSGSGGGDAGGSGSGSDGTPQQQPPTPKGPGPAESSGRLWVPGR